MTNITTNTKKAATASKAAQKTAPSHTTRVCISTAEKISHLADRFDQSPALIAGALAEIGNELLGSNRYAEEAGTCFEELMMTVIRRSECLPRPKCIIPILTEEHIGQASRGWAKDMNMTLEEWLGCMVEIGISNYHKPRLMQSLLPSMEEAFFTTASVRIKGDHEGNPEAVEILKPQPEAPHAFISFERMLAAKGGKE